MTRLQDLRAQLRELRRDMRAAGIKKTSPFNGGMDAATYRANARRFQLETEIEALEARAATTPAEAAQCSFSGF